MADKQYAKDCRDCKQRIYMLEHEGKWRAYDDQAHTKPHDCPKNPTLKSAGSQTGASQYSSPAAGAQAPTAGSSPTSSASSRPETPKNTFPPGGYPPQSRAFTEADEQVIRRIVVDELKKRLGGLIE